MYTADGQRKVDTMILQMFNTTTSQHYNLVEGLDLFFETSVPEIGEVLRLALLSVPIGNT